MNGKALARLATLWLHSWSLSCRGTGRSCLGLLMCCGFKSSPRGRARVGTPETVLGTPQASWAAACSLAARVLPRLVASSERGGSGQSDIHPGGSAPSDSG